MIAWKHGVGRGHLSLHYGMSMGFAEG